MNILFKASALAAATASLATALPAGAAVAFTSNPHAAVSTGAPDTANDYRDWHRDRRYGRDDYRRGYRNDYRGNDRGYNRTWRGNDGRYYCRKGDGTTGLLIGGAAGALLGRGIDGGRDHTRGTILGAAGGALLGREVDRGNSRCR